MPGAVLDHHEPGELFHRHTPLRQTALPLRAVHEPLVTCPPNLPGRSLPVKAANAADHRRNAAAPTTAAARI